MTGRKYAIDLLCYKGIDHLEDKKAINSHFKAILGKSKITILNYEKEPPTLYVEYRGKMSPKKVPSFIEKKFAGKNIEARVRETDYSNESNSSTDNIGDSVIPDSHDNDRML